eukprot:SAG31_NODE_1348_length_8693_cov_4.345008_9_plen_185_part_00
MTISDEELQERGEGETGRKSNGGSSGSMQSATVATSGHGVGNVTSSQDPMMLQESICGGGGGVVIGGSDGLVRSGRVKGVYTRALAALLRRVGAIRRRARRRRRSASCCRSGRPLSLRRHCGAGEGRGGEARPQWRKQWRKRTKLLRIRRSFGCCTLGLAAVPWLLYRCTCTLLLMMSCGPASI